MIVKENLLIIPSLVNVNTIGQLEGYTHQASFIYIDERAVIRSVIIQLNDVLHSYSRGCFGVSALPVNGLIVRLLG
jgi:urease accessory protein